MTAVAVVSVVLGWMVRLWIAVAVAVVVAVVAPTLAALVVARCWGAGGCTRRSWCCCCCGGGVGGRVLWHSLKVGDLTGVELQRELEYPGLQGDGGGGGVGVYNDTFQVHAKARSDTNFAANRQLWGRTWC